MDVTSALRRELRDKVRALRQEAKRIPAISPDEEQDLARRAESGDVDAFHALIKANLAFAYRVAMRFSRRHFDMSADDFDDLVQESCLALIEAATKFDSGGTGRLATYAETRLFKYLRRWCASRSVVRPPTRGVTVGDLRLNDDDNRDEEDEDFDPRTHAALVDPGIDHEMRDLLRAARWRSTVALLQLTERQRFVIEQRYLNDNEPVRSLGDQRRSSHRDQGGRRFTYRHGGGLASCTFDDLGKQLNVSDETIRRLEIEALEKLRGLLVDFAEDFFGPRPASSNEARRALEERFWKKVTKTNGCWIWKAGRSHGHGVINVNGSAKAAHRVAWELQHGPLPPGVLVLQRCGNPLCVCLHHLYTEAGSALTLGRLQRARKGRAA